MVARIGRVDRDKRDLRQVFAFHFRRLCGLGRFDHFIWKINRNAMRMNGQNARGFGIVRLANNFCNHRKFRPISAPASARLQACNDKVAVLGITGILMFNHHFAAILAVGRHNTSAAISHACIEAGKLRCFTLRQGLYQLCLPALLGLVYLAQSLVARAGLFDLSFALHASIDDFRAVRGFTPHHAANQVTMLIYAFKGDDTSRGRGIGLGIGALCGAFELAVLFKLFEDMAQLCATLTGNM